MHGNQLVLHSPVGFVVAFGAGIISFLSPCVLPLVPSYLSMMSGVGAADLAVATKPDQRRLLRSTLLFVLGFTVVFALIEATASGIGQGLRNHQGALDTAAGIVIIAGGVLLAGVVRPAWLMRERRFHVSPSQLGEWAAPVMGMAFAVGWTPCIGPMLGVIQSLALSAGSVGTAAALAVCYSLGLGLPFVLLAVGFGWATGAVAVLRRHIRAINLAGGALLVVVGVLMVSGVWTLAISALQSWVGGYVSPI